jgi:hypothetical protein
MNPNLEKFKYFIGKPITVFTIHTGRNFTEAQFNDYFTGVCQAVHVDAIETLHPITNCKNLFFFNNIVGICEEQQLDPENPEHQEIIKEIKKEAPVEQQNDLQPNNSVNIDIDLLNKIIAK